MWLRRLLRFRYLVLAVFSALLIISACGVISENSGEPPVEPPVASSPAETKQPDHTSVEKGAIEFNPITNTYKALLPPKNDKGQVQKWETTNLTYSFVTAQNAPGYPDDHPEKISPVPTETKAYIREILEHMYAAVVPLTFKEVADTNEPKTTANIRVMLYEDNSDTYASAYFPKDFGDSRDGDVFLYTGGGNWKNGPGSAEYATLFHELGHSLGLKHPGNYSEEEVPPFFPNDMENPLNSVMSYNVNPDLSKQPSSWNWSLMAYDIAALQSLYGANRNFHAGDTVYKFTAKPRATFSYSETTLQFQATQALWDGGGVNSIDMTELPAEANGYHFDLQANGQLTTNDAFNTGGCVLHSPEIQNPDGDPEQTFPMSKFATVIGFGVKIQDLQGTTSADTVIGNAENNHLRGLGGDDRLDGGAGNDWLEGGAGNDVLIASAGQNHLDGGAGDDIYKITLSKASGTQIFDPTGRDELIFAEKISPSLGLAAGKLGMTRQGQDLLIDLNQDGKATVKDDLVISKFFTSGMIESIANRPGREIAAGLKART